MAAVWIRGLLGSWVTESKAMRPIVGLLGALSVSGCAGGGDRVADIPGMASDYILVLSQSGELYEFPVRTIEASAISSTKYDVYVDLDRSMNPPEKMNMLVHVLRRSATSVRTYDIGDEGCRTESRQDRPPCLANAMDAAFQSTYWNTLGSFEPRQARNEIRSLRGNVAMTSHYEGYEIWVVHGGVIQATADALVGDDTRFVSLSVRASPGNEEAFKELLLGLASLRSAAAPGSALLIRLPVSETAVFQNAVIFTH